MIQKKYIFTYFVILFFANSEINAGIINFIEKIVFGTLEADDQKQDLCNEIKNSLNITSEHEVYYAQWPWHYFSSFTLHSGTWIDRAVWETLDINEQIFTMYHELSHKALNHITKQLLTSVATLVSTVYFMNNYGSQYLTEKIATLCKLHNKSYLIRYGITMLTSISIFVAVTSFYAHKCEQEADEKAAEILCEQGRTDIVGERIAQLENISEEYGNIKSIWFPSIDNQIHYLKEILHLYL